MKVVIIELDCFPKIRDFNPGRAKSKDDRRQGR